MTGQEKTQDLIFKGSISCRDSNMEEDRDEGRQS